MCQLALPFLLLTLIDPQVVLAQTSCISPHGGYCVELESAKIYPGVEFLGDITDFGTLLIQLYRFGVVLAAISAFVVLVIAGAMYLTAGDNQGRITKARAFISNALFGLAIALLSWLVLYTLNPDLVRGWTLGSKLPAIRSQATAAERYRCRSGLPLNKCYGPEFSDPDCDSLCFAGSSCVNVTSC